MPPKLDKFYTDDKVAKNLTQEVFARYPASNFDVILEPSAGSGAFLKALPADKRVGIDLSPDNSEVQKADFFEWQWEPTKKYLVIGNPPFGRVSSLAVQFFQRSAEFADVIAFLIPRTFRRISVQNRLPMNFHLVYDKEIPVKPCVFSPPMSAKCCFQIWEKRQSLRSKITMPSSCSDWEFLPLGPVDNKGQPTPPKGASFALRAYGANCGQIYTDNLAQLRPKSYHWIKSIRPQEELIAEFNKLDYSISKDTVRQDSIGRKELVWLYKNKIITNNKKDLK